MSVGRRRFRIIKEIAEGGFGKVYLAEQISSDGFSRIVAVKLLHAKWSSHDEVVMRTRDEARLLGLIRHQHIVKVEDLTSIDSKCAIVMEYLEGVDLKWMITFLKDRGEHFPRAALFEIMLSVCSALDAAYNGRPLQGGEPLRVIHRDIKPSNIFSTVAGGIKVLDFGTARANFAEREAKTQALAFGSQGYMAPERMLGEEDTPAADVFSLGITLYELLALESFGRIPPRPNKFAKKLEERLSEIPLDGPPAWCDSVIETLRGMLSYEPDDRPSAAQLVETMEVLAQDGADMGIRRFCRTLVAEAKTALPDLDTGDPLAGQIVDEDASASFAPSTAPGASNPGMASSPATLGGPAAGSAAKRTSTPAPSQIKIQGPAVAEPPDAGGGNGMWIGLGIVAVLAMLGLGGLAIVGTGAAIFVSSEGVPYSEPEPEPAPEPTKPPPNVGGNVISDDRRDDAKRAATTLKYDGAGGAQIIISNRTGFKAEWDGKEDFAVGKMAEGRYSTTIEKPGGKKVRGKSFSIEAGKSDCVWTFDAGSDAWAGGCR